MGLDSRAMNSFRNWRGITKPNTSGCSITTSATPLRSNFCTDSFQRTFISSSIKSDEGIPRTSSVTTFPIRIGNTFERSTAGTSSSLNPRALSHSESLTEQGREGVLIVVKNGHQTRSGHHSLCVQSERRKFPAKKSFRVWQIANAHIHDQ